MSFTGHAKELYYEAKKYMNENKELLNCNVLEYVCRYHHCITHGFDTPKLLFDELTRHFNKQTAGTIIQLIRALADGKKGKTFVQWQAHLDALQHAEEILNPTENAE